MQAGDDNLHAKIATNRNSNMGIYLLSIGSAKWLSNIPGLKKMAVIFKNTNFWKGIDILKIDTEKQLIMINKS